MNILYISSAVSEAYFKKINVEVSNQKNLYGMPVAANRFHNLIMNGFVKNGHDVDALSVRPFSRETHKKLYYKKFRELLSGSYRYYYVTIINLPVLKNVCNLLQVYFYIKNWVKRVEGEKVIIYDASYVSILPAISFLTNSSFKKVGIFMDIYNYMADVNVVNKNDSILTNIVRKMAKHCYDSTNKYIFLSEEMNKVINHKEKDYYVMEGVIESSLINYNNKVYDKKIRLMYAGALKEEYGLKLLLHSFHKIKNENIELLIFGAGDYSNEIEVFSKKDTRIKFFGNVDHDTILQNEQKVDILINPRPTNQSFTKYSFPSKLLEYMNSGTATLTTRLPSIPHDYYKYLYFIDDETIDGLKSVLECLISQGKMQLIEKGKSAQTFVQKTKNELVQSNKILEDLF